MTPAMLIMARAPRAGSVKTRLQSLLGPDGCARLQAVLIGRTLQLAERVAPGRVFIALDSAYPIDGGMRVLAQRGDDLGARMRNAAREVWAEHDGPLVMIGTDAPTLHEMHLCAAAAALQSGVDVVFGPALDGGYYLLGLHRPADAVFGIDPALWGGPGVLTASRAAADAAGLRTVLLDPLRDLDTPADAAAFREDGTLPQELVALLTPTGALS